MGLGTPILSSNALFFILKLKYARNSHSCMLQHVVYVSVCSIRHLDMMQRAQINACDVIRTHVNCKGFLLTKSLNFIDIDWALEIKAPIEPNTKTRCPIAARGEF